MKLHVLVHFVHTVSHPTLISSEVVASNTSLLSLEIFAHPSFLPFTSQRSTHCPSPLYSCQREKNTALDTPTLLSHPPLLCLGSSL